MGTLGGRCLLLSAMVPLSTSCWIWLLLLLIVVVLSLVGNLFLLLLPAPLEEMRVGPGNKGGAERGGGGEDDDG